MKSDVTKPQGFEVNLFSLLLGTFAINVLSLALPVMTTQVYNRILPNPDSGTLPVLVVGVCVAIILEMVLRLCRAYMMGFSGAAYEHRLSCEAMDHVLKANTRYIGSQGIAEHLHRMAAIGKLKDLYNGYALITLSELAFVPLFLLLIYYIAGELVVVPLFVLTLFILVSLWTGAKLRQSLKERDMADDKRFDFLIESLEGIHTIKSFALENFFERRYEALERRSSLSNFKVTQDTSATFDMGTIFSQLMVAIVISSGAYYVLHEGLTTGVLIATLLLSGRVMQPVQRALGLWAKYQNFSLARDKVKKLFKVPLHSSGRVAEEPQREGVLHIADTRFRYKKNDPWLLKNINLHVDKGTAILLTGDHGSGKSTLLNLIAGVFPPIHGLIEVDGVNAAYYPQNSLTRHVGYIRTEGVIFRGTIRDNLTSFGEIEEKSAREFAALLKVDRDVSKLPSGFDTFLSGNNTDIIPPGLKQRISMVRALAARPSLILFDNADRSLDSEGYRLVYSLLSGLKGKMTMIIVSDDPNLRSLADQTYLLAGGLLRNSDSLSSVVNIKGGNIKAYRDGKS